MFRTKFVEQIKTRVSLSVTIPENRAVYEIMWKNMVETDRQTADGNITLAHFMLNTSTNNTLSEYVILIVFHCNNGCANTPKCYV
jgi:hypothetical protein